jgi:hypothetical protein
MTDFYQLYSCRQVVGRVDRVGPRGGGLRGYHSGLGFPAREEFRARNARGCEKSFPNDRGLVTRVFGDQRDIYGRTAGRVAGVIEHNVSCPLDPEERTGHGAVTRFGWKAQNKSLLVFAGEAYNVENEAFPNEREDDPNCQLNQLPEDATNLADNGYSNSPASGYSSDIINFAGFMRLSAGPIPAPATGSADAVGSRRRA